MTEEQVLEGIRAGTMTVDEPLVESPVTGRLMTMAEAQRELEAHRRQRIVHVRASPEVRRTPVGKPGKAAQARRNRARKQAKASRRRNR